jgi:hypothetical protein
MKRRIDRQVGKPTDRKTDVGTNGQRDIHAHKYTDRQIDREKGRQTDK